MHLSHPYTQHVQKHVRTHAPACAHRRQQPGEEPPGEEQQVTQGEEIQEELPIPQASATNPKAEP
jgi:hypothetical protein